jgi:hypothetical protein
MLTKRTHQLLAYQSREALRLFRQGCVRDLAPACLDSAASGPISAGATSPALLGSKQEVIP